MRCLSAPALCLLASPPEPTPRVSTGTAGSNMQIPRHKQFSVCNTHVAFTEQLLLHLSRLGLAGATGRETFSLNPLRFVLKNFPNIWAGALQHCRFLPLRVARRASPDVVSSGALILAAFNRSCMKLKLKTTAVPSTLRSGRLLVQVLLTSVSRCGRRDTRKQKASQAVCISAPKEG